MGELISRGTLSDLEVRQVALGPFDKGDAPSADFLDLRVASFVRALQDKGELANYAPILARVLVDVPIHRAYEGSVLGHLIGPVERQGIDFSPSAFMFLERGRFVEESLSYLQDNIKDLATFQKLSETTVRPEFEERKQLALNRIRRRMANPTKGRGTNRTK